MARLVHNYMRHGSVCSGHLHVMVIAERPPEKHVKTVKSIQRYLFKPLLYALIWGSVCGFTWGKYLASKALL